MKPQTVTIDDLAVHWSITPRRVRMLADEIPIASKGGKFDLLEADRAYIKWLQRDEPTRRSKRELLAWQRHRIEAAIARDDRKVLQPDEIRALIEQAWSALRQGHLAALNGLYSTLSGALGEPAARLQVAQLEQRINGELSLCRGALERIYGASLERMASEVRNGILTNTRRIAALREAIGPDAGPG